MKYTITTLLLLELSFINLFLAAIIAPPWVHNNTEACGGWQEVRWPADGRCYRIFRQGPCPDTMEIAFRSDRREAECQCPPGKAQWARDGKCHKLYRRGPCAIGQYFGPVINTRWGVCSEPELTCSNDQLYWAEGEGKCYHRLTKGPCPIGELLIAEEPGSDLGLCQCNNSDELSKFKWISSNDACYELYTRGPCGKGEIVLPDPLRCGCSSDIPQYYNVTNECYELGTVGPCPAGQNFVHKIKENAQCECKENHVQWSDSAACYREYTRGPCQVGMMLIPPVSGVNNKSECVPLLCPKGELFFPKEEKCYKAGTQGPCPEGTLVVFDDFVGHSYKGRCGCSVKDFPNLAWDNGNECYEVGNQGPCPKGHVFGPGGSCYTIYSRGYCTSPGEWLVPKRGSSALCECKPGYGVAVGEEICQPPLVLLARFLSATP